MKIIYLLLSSATLSFLFSCSKSSSSSISLKIESFNPSTVPVGSGAQVYFKFTDKGHLLDTLVILKTRINQLTTPTIRDTIFYSVPSYPQTSNGELQVNLDYSNDLQSAISPPTTGNPPANESDSLIFRFVAIDEAHNVSDTAVSGLVVVQR
jgi:hypothetical protein